MMKMFGTAAAFLAFLHMTLAESETAPCVTVTIPDFLTNNWTHCYDEKPVDICTPFNENDTEKVREIINCTNYDANYKVLALTILLNDFVASTLPEEERNQSFSQTQFIVNWCATGMPLPTFLYNLTCDEYLAQVTVTCDKPVTLSVPDVNNLGQCINDNPITQVCNEGNTITWKTFTELVAVLRCIYFSIIPILPFPEY